MLELRRVLDALDQMSAILNIREGSLFDRRDYRGNESELETLLTTLLIGLLSSGSFDRSFRRDIEKIVSLPLYFSSPTNRFCSKSSRCIQNIEYILIDQSWLCHLCRNARRPAFVVDASYVNGILSPNSKVSTASGLNEEVNANSVEISGIAAREGIPYDGVCFRS